MGPPVLLVDQQALGVELLDRCLDGIVDAFLVQVEALGLQELEDVLLLLVAAALSDVDLLSGSDADATPRSSSCPRRSGSGTFPSVSPPSHLVDKKEKMHSGLGWSLCAFNISGHVLEEPAEKEL